MLLFSQSMWVGCVAKVPIEPKGWIDIVDLAIARKPERPEKAEPEPPQPQKPKTGQDTVQGFLQKKNWVQADLNNQEQEAELGVINPNVSKCKAV